VANVPTSSRQTHITRAAEYAARGENLTAAGYAEYIGITEKAARDLVRKLGLPLTSNEIRAAAAAEEKTGDGTGAPAKPDNTVPPIDPKDPNAGILQVATERADTVARSVITARLDELTRALKATPKAPPAQAPEAGSPTAGAVAAATDVVSRRHRDSVVALAEEIQTTDEDAGEVVRRLWHEKYRPEFPSGPGPMVLEWENFWWKYRDTIRGLQDLVDQYYAANEDLKAQLEPAAQRQEALDRVLAWAYGLQLEGKIVPPLYVEHLLHLAEAFINGQPLPTFVPPSSLPGPGVHG
jgi:hypothetical protein